MLRHRIPHDVSANAPSNGAECNLVRSHTLTCNLMHPNYRNPQTPNAFNPSNNCVLTLKETLNDSTSCTRGREEREDGRKVESSVVTTELIRHVYSNFIAPTLTYSPSLIRRESLVSNAKQSAQAKRKQMKSELSDLSVKVSAPLMKWLPHGKPMLGLENPS
jgi:hypothetical protein